MIYDKNVPPPFILHVDIHRLEIGYLVEVEGRCRGQYEPVLRRFAVANLTAVDATIHHEASRFLTDVGKFVDADIKKNG